MTRRELQNFYDLVLYSKIFVSVTFKVKNKMVTTLITPDTTTSIIKPFLLDLQQEIVAVLEAEEGNKQFLTDEWQYQEGGGGITRVLSEGQIIEKAGVNFSHVRWLFITAGGDSKTP